MRIKYTDQRSEAECHALAAAEAADWMLEAIIADLGRRNLRDYSNHETRWLAQRASACRAERRKRKAIGKYNPYQSFNHRTVTP